MCVWQWMFVLGDKENAHIMPSFLRHSCKTQRHQETAKKDGLTELRGFHRLRQSFTCYNLNTELGSIEDDLHVGFC